MTSIGKNIKKIRAVKKLSQAQFAEIFNLARPSVGAYEEGRAEPKLETIVQIAHYFGISIDALVNKELTINELYSFNILNEKLNKEHERVKGPAAAAKIQTIGLIQISQYLEYIVNRQNKDYVLNLPQTTLPEKFKGEARAFEHNGSEMEYHQHGLHHGDILYTKLVPVKQLKVDKIYTVIHPEGIIVRRLASVEDNVLKFSADDPNYQVIELVKSEILETWEVKGVYTTYLNPPKLVEEKILSVEKRVMELEKHLGKKKTT